MAESGAASSSGAFPPPERYSFDPKDWTSWISRFERYRQLNEITKKSDDFQINALVYCMGEKADEILISLALSTAEAKKYDNVKEAFETYFIGKRNVVYERARFGLRNQEDGEPIESFVTALHILSQHCEYGQLKEDLVRDRIVLGVKDKRLREKLMLTETLTLPKAIEISKNWEAVKRQQGELQGEDEQRSLDSVNKGSNFKPRPEPGIIKTGRKSYTSANQRQAPNQSSSNAKSGKCKFCGIEHVYLKSACPAFGKTCNACSQDNHFSRCCPNKSQETAQANTMNCVQTKEDFFMIGSIHDAPNSQPPTNRFQRWQVTIEVDNKPIDFKMDSGADVTAIPYYIFRKLWKTRRINEPDRRLTGPDGTQLTTVGVMTAKLKSRHGQTQEVVYIIKGLQQPLLGLSACEDLQLLKRLNEVNVSPSKVKPHEEFPELFTGLGKMDTPYTVKVKSTAEPYAIHSPRRVPIPLMRTVQEKLEQMVQQGVIEHVQEPTEWCAPLVTAAKPNGDIRLCVDFTALNKSVEREFHPMPVIEHTLGQLAGAKIFSKLDANSGFYQVLLSPQCRNYTTFLTPFGRYRFRRMPMGISSAPEHFQKRMSEILNGVPGVLIHVDDILIYGSTSNDHDDRLRAVLKKIKDAGVTLNKDKCVFGVDKVKFLGHVIDSEGIRPDPEKISAITDMPAPTSPTEIKRFLGMTNFLGRFIPHLSSIGKPLHELTKKDRHFLWDHVHQESFSKIKEILTKEPILAMFDANKKTIVSSDASSYGLGAALLQLQEDGLIKPVAYASRTMSTAERRYAQIEKECLAITWASERFRDFLTGLTFHIQTDHKPLIPILSTKSVDDLSPRLQRFRIRLMRYSFTISYVPGKNLVLADALSRQPLPDNNVTELEEEVSLYVCHVMSSLPVTDEKLKEIWLSQQEDVIIRQVIKFCLSEWPDKPSEINPSVRKYWSSKDDLTVQNGLLMKNGRIVIPPVMQREILGRIHDGHMGVTKCRARARQSCWWPGISEEIAEMVRCCPICVQERKERKEPLMPSPFPARPWQRLAMDLFKSHGRWFLLVVDFYSRYPEVIELNSMSSSAVIRSLKVIFSRHGVPEEILSDNGPQFHPVRTSPFQQFAREYGFIHKTSSPHFPQANGFAENGVKIAKNLLQKNSDWYQAILSYRATPLQNGYSPGELLMGRRLRTTLPLSPCKLVPEIANQEKLREHEENRINKQKRTFDEAHGVHIKDDFTQGEIVWVKDLRSWGTVKKKAEAPRSYIVQTSRGEFRRNSSFLTRSYLSQFPDLVPELHSNPEQIDLEPPQLQIEARHPATPYYHTRSGRAVKPPRRLIEEI